MVLFNPFSYYIETIWQNVKQELGDITYVKSRPRARPLQLTHKRPPLIQSQPEAAADCSHFPYSYMSHSIRFIIVRLSMLISNTKPKCIVKFVGWSGISITNSYVCSYVILFIVCQTTNIKGGNLT